MFGVFSRKRQQVSGAEQTNTTTAPPPTNIKHTIDPLNSILVNCQPLPSDASVPVELPVSAKQFAVTVDGLVSDSESAALIAATREVGYESALINVGGNVQMRDDSVRKSGRCIIDTPAFAAALWARLKPFLPASHHALGGEWQPTGLNERMRFLRYEPGDYFRPHTDGSFARKVGDRKGERSFLTLMVYLDSPELGGETNFLDPQKSGAKASVQPHAGLGLVFEHELLHEGAELRRGVKHALRTDVTTRRRSNPGLAAPLVCTGAPFCMP